MTPTQRALQECRKRQWPACVVERWLPRCNIRVDCFGFGDIIALDGEPGALLIQVTDTSHAANRVRKIETLTNGMPQAWVGAGNRIAVWGFAKRGPVGKRKVWTLKEYKVTV